MGKTLLGFVIVVSGHIMAVYLKWHMCPCHEPLVVLIPICYMRLTSINNRNIFPRLAN